MLDDAGVGYESKVGYTTRTREIVRQVERDRELIDSGDLPGGAEWHFYPSATTGKLGPSRPLMDLLDGFGDQVPIPYVVHLPPS